MADKLASLIQGLVRAIFTVEDRESLRRMTARTIICIVIGLFAVLLHWFGEAFLRHHMPSLFMLAWLSITFAIYIVDIFLFFAGLYTEIKIRTADSITNSKLLLAVMIIISIFSGITFGQPLRTWTLDALEKAGSSLARTARDARKQDVPAANSQAPIH